MRKKIVVLEDGGYLEKDVVTGLVYHHEPEESEKPLQTLTPKRKASKKNEETPDEGDAK